ncbi:hypothetical protein M405DRAFT_113327 [Rhizopogon salebrosus TDB-379]|nr:hypothetical protein M405DRAFT_113327 [Rhizopogon salebrosus TDB-379]
MHTPLWATGSAQCYNRHTTATPLWRRDDGNGLQCFHGSARPINMKSDIIHKHSRHDACGLTTHHQFSTSLESVLPIWSSSVQSPCLQPDARVSSFCMTSLIPVLLSCSPLCTFLHPILLAFPTLMVPRPCPTLRSHVPLSVHCKLIIVSCLAHLIMVSDVWYGITNEAIIGACFLPQRIEIHHWNPGCRSPIR